MAASIDNNNNNDSKKQDQRLGDPKAFSISRSTNGYLRQTRGMSYAVDQKWSGKIKKTFS